MMERLKSPTSGTLTMVSFISGAGCERVERFSPPLEFMIEPRSTRAVGWYQREHELDDEWETGLLNAIDQYGGDKYVGIHNTDVQSARAIVSDGFNSSDSRPSAPRVCVVVLCSHGTIGLTRVGC